MAIYTVQVLGSCPGGEHATISVLRDGLAIKQVVMTRSELIQPTASWEDVLVLFMRQAIKKAGATTPGQIKAAVEAASWTL